MSIHIIPAVFTAYRTTTTKPRNQWDYGQVLNISGQIDLPEAFEAHFCCEGDPTTVTQIGQNGLVEVPYEYMETGRTVLCYIFLHDASTDGRTMYTIRIPIVRRPRPTDLEPTPVQQDAIAEALVALNNAVVRTDASATRLRNRRSLQAHRRQQHWSQPRAHRHPLPVRVRVLPVQASLRRVHGSLLPVRASQRAMQAGMRTGQSRRRLRAGIWMSRL